MKKTTLVTILLLLNVLFGFSQEFNPEIRYGKVYYEIEKPTKAYLFGDNVRLREEPNTDSKFLVEIPIDSEIEIIEKTEFTQLINGIESNWVKIEYKEYKGYILDNFISVCTKTNINSTLLTTYKKEFKKLYLLLRYLDKQTNIYIEDKYSINYENAEILFLENINLSEISDVLIIDYFAEACGIEGGKDLIFRFEEFTIETVELSAVSDSGVYWLVEDIEFPNEEN